MISLVVFISLLAFSVDGRRSDYVSSISPSAQTHWGSWGPEDWCLKGQYAYGFSLKVEGSQRGGDDSAVNGIKLHCRSLSGGHNHDISSSVGKWGKWKHATYCPKHQFLTDVKMRSEKPQHSGDDTAVNDFNFVCKSSTNSGDAYRLRGHGKTWGTWSNRKSCPVGSYICGVKTKVEKPQGRGDDTALNEAVFYCCKFRLCAVAREFHIIPR